MPVWPKFVYTLNVGLRTAATRLKLRQPEAAPAHQELAFADLTRELCKASYWKEAGIESGMSYSLFQARVPVQSYERLAPSIGQMTRGESDVLWPGRCTLFGLTAGTSGGQPRCIPMTVDLLAHLRRAGFESLLYFAGRTRHAGAFAGRHLFVGGPTALTALSEPGPHATFQGEASGVVVLNLPKWAEEHLYEPGRQIAQIPEWDAQVAAIAGRTRSSDVTLIAGVPNSVQQLSQVLRTRFSNGARSAPPLQEFWPNLRCFAHSGAAITPYAVQLRRALGPSVMFHDTYAASECVVAAQDGEPGLGLRVTADQGVFFEFVPLADFDDMPLEHLGSRAVPLAGVKINVDYVILVTTPGGLARYVLGDVVRFTSVTPPRLLYVGRTQLRLNAFGENVAEKDLIDALAGLCHQREWTLVNFHVAPLFGRPNRTGLQRGAHEWWVELEPGTTATPTGPQMAEELDRQLLRAHPRYNARRTAGILESPTVRLVMPGVFEHWLRFHQKWGGQHKMPRCRGDRLVADEFAHVTNFARD